MKNNLNCLIALVASTTLLTACATHESRVEDEFGQAVREMIKLQTLDPAARERNDSVVSKTSDGVATEKVLDAYRKRVITPESIGNDITINVGGE